MKKQIFGLCILLCASVSIFSQENARIQAMGNSDIIPDISRTIFYNPAYMNNYKDQVQVTFNSPIIGIKSVGNMFSLGLVFNQGLIIDNSFYGDAFAMLPAIPTTGVTLPIQYNPHLLMGLDLSSVKLALDWFWERSAYSLDATTAGVSSTDDRSINNFGVLAGATLNFSGIDWAFLAGFGIPNMDSKQNTGTPPVTESKSQKGLYLRLGAEAQFGLFSLDWTLGAKYNLVSYQFVNAAGVKQNDNTENVVIPYIGFKKELLDKILLVVLEKTELKYLESDNSSGSPKNSIDTVAYIWSAGLEKQFPNVWIFDSLALRGGISDSVVYGSTHLKTTVAPNTNTSDLSYPTKLGPAVPYLGIGVTKKFFCLDLVVNPMAWTGVFVGPPVARCTATFIF
jgi:hypothetical protein